MPRRHCLSLVLSALVPLTLWAMPPVLVAPLSCNISSQVMAYVMMRQRALLEAPTFFSSSVPPGGLDIELTQKTLCHQEKEGGGVLLAQKPGVGALGYISLVLEKSNPKKAHKAVIEEIYVAPEARGTGLGKILLKEAVSFVPMTVSHMYLKVNVANGAKKLYEKCGFKTWALEPFATIVDGAPQTFAHMVLTLGHLVSLGQDPCSK